jgi:hypothetical protein
MPEPSIPPSNGKLKPYLNGDKSEGKKQAELYARILKRSRRDPTPMAEGCAYRRILAISAVRAEEGDKKRAGINSALGPSLMCLFCLLMRRRSQYLTWWYWRAWLRELGHALLSEVDGRSLLLAWSLWAGRAPPVVTEVTPRQ